MQVVTVALLAGMKFLARTFFLLFLLLGVLIAVSNTERTELALWPIPHTVVLPLSQYGLVPGDEIKLFGRVEDNDPAGPNGAESTVVVVRIDPDRRQRAAQGALRTEQRSDQARAQHRHRVRSAVAQLRPFCVE